MKPMSASQSALGLDSARVVVAMSGGVDSAVTAALLQDAGMDVHAVTLRMWQAPFIKAADIVASARAVAEHLQIPFSVVDLEARFYSEVVLPFVQAYALGRTPNPCVMCNPTIKFAALLAAADRLGARWVATGHYARLALSPWGDTRLLRACNLRRDQSYVLYRLPQRVLRRLRMPLGDVADKAEVRAIAQQLALPPVDRPDSQDLCFLGGGDYRQLVTALRPESLRPGPMYDEQGKCLGQHQGLPLYTVGQRKGLGVAAGYPLYVLSLLPEENALLVGPKASLTREVCELASVVFVAGEPPGEFFAAQASVRYHAPPVPVHVQMLASDRARVTFDTPVTGGLTPGQSLVWYEGDVVIGGGIIIDQVDDFT